jgi:4-amino-4-deoxychorismate lyase
MHARFIYNDQLLAAPPEGGDALALYGRGVFTTLAVYNHRPFLWPRHWARLLEHAARVQLCVTEFDEPSVRALLAGLIEANGVKEGRARVTLTAAVEQGIWRMGENPSRQADLRIITGEMRPVPEAGLALTVSPYRVNTLSPLTGIKSVNYLDRILPWEESRARDFDEAVMLNERGEVVSTALANIFWVTNGTIHTPSLATGALAGTTRARVMELAAELSAPLVEGVYDLSDLGDANEIFLTSAGQGLSIVTTFDFHRYTVPVGSVALRLREAFRQLTLQIES